MNTTYPNLKAEMARFGILGKDIASCIGCTPNTYTNKMTGKSDFTLSESIKIHTRYFPHISIGELFTRHEPAAPAV